MSLGDDCLGVLISSRQLGGDQDCGVGTPECGETVGPDFPFDEIIYGWAAVGVVAHLPVHFVDGVSPITTPVNGPLVPCEELPDSYHLLGGERAADMEWVAVVAHAAPVQIHRRTVEMVRRRDRVRRGVAGRVFISQGFDVGVEVSGERPHDGEWLTFVDLQIHASPRNGRPLEGVLSDPGWFPAVLRTHWPVTTVTVGLILGSGKALTGLQPAHIAMMRASTATRFMICP